MSLKIIAWISNFLQVLLVQKNSNSNKPGEANWQCLVFLKKNYQDFNSFLFEQAAAAQGGVPCFYPKIFNK